MSYQYNHPAGRVAVTYVGPTLVPRTTRNRPSWLSVRMIRRRPRRRLKRSVWGPFERRGASKTHQRSRPSRWASPRDAEARTIPRASPRSTGSAARLAECQAESEHAVPVLGRVRAAVRRPAVAGVADPAIAAIHPSEAPAGPGGSSSGDAS